jgi:anti-sigma B factor antagonist
MASLDDSESRDAGASQMALHVQGAGEQLGRSFWAVTQQTVRKQRRQRVEITERTVEAITVLDVVGKLTAGAAAQLLKDKTESLVFQSRKQLIVNLGGVPYIDSGGLGQLVACYTTLAKAGGRLTLTNLNAKNHDLLSITKLVSVFETFDSEAEAIASYQPTARV